MRKPITSPIMSQPFGVTTTRMAHTRRFDGETTMINAGGKTVRWETCSCGHWTQGHTTETGALDELMRHCASYDER
jgi:hypothetical protein